MRMRSRAVTALAATALAIGGFTAATAASANAAPAVAATARPAAAAASWHFYASYWTKPECDAAGRTYGQTYKCTYGKGTDGRYKYHLYLWY